MPVALVGFVTPDILTASGAICATIGVVFVLFQLKAQRRAKRLLESHLQQYKAERLMGLAHDLQKDDVSFRKLDEARKLLESELKNVEQPSRSQVAQVLSQSSPKAQARYMASVFANSATASKDCRQ
jgi:hypothetical protein